MIAKTPDAPQGSGMPKQQARGNVRVSKEMLRVFGQEYDLAPSMSREAYELFMQNLDRDYGETVQSPTLMKVAGRAAADFKLAYDDGSQQVEAAERRLAAGLDRAIAAMGKERGQPFTPQEALAAKIIVTRAATGDYPEAREEEQQQKERSPQRRQGDHAMHKAAQQYGEPAQQGAQGEGPGFEDVAPSDEFRAAALPPRSRQPQGRTGPKPPRR